MNREKAKRRLNLFFITISLKIYFFYIKNQFCIVTRSLYKALALSHVHRLVYFKPIFLKNKVQRVMDSIAYTLEDLKTFYYTVAVAVCPDLFSLLF